MRLRRRSRYDTLQNEIRRRGRSWGRWIYLALLCGLFLWIADMFVGNLLYFQADGLVMRDRVVLATQYPAEVKKLNVEEGSLITKGELLAQVRSQKVEETFAQLYSDMAQAIVRSTDLEVRSKVYKAIYPMAQHRYQEAHAARLATDKLTDENRLTNMRRAELLKGEIDSAQAQTQIEAEQSTIEQNVPDIKAAVAASKAAVTRLRDIYADGTLKAPSDGVVGYLHVAEGSVVRPGDPLMELFTNKPYILAYVPEGALYDLSPGDPVKIRVGFSTYYGKVSRLYPLASRLPKEFQNTFQPAARAQVVRIEFDPSDHYPALFSKTKLSAADWSPAWLRHLFSGSYESIAEAFTAMQTKLDNFSQALQRKLDNVVG